MYYREKMRRLEAEFNKAFGEKNDDESPMAHCSYVEDFDEESVIACKNGAKYKVSFTGDVEKPDFAKEDDWVEVEASTDYVPMTEDRKKEVEKENSEKDEEKKAKEKGEKVAKEMYEE